MLRMMFKIMVFLSSVVVILADSEQRSGQPVPAPNADPISYLQVSCVEKSINNGACAKFSVLNNNRSGKIEQDSSGNRIFIYWQDSLADDSGAVFVQTNHPSLYQLDVKKDAIVSQILKIYGDNSHLEVSMFDNSNNKSIIVDPMTKLGNGKTLLQVQSIELLPDNALAVLFLKSLDNQEIALQGQVAAGLEFHHANGSEIESSRVDAADNLFVYTGNFSEMKSIHFTHSDGLTINVSLPNKAFADREIELGVH